MYSDAFKQSDIARFSALVNAAGECYEWTGGVTNKGYGKLKINGKTMLAHRVSWIIENGPIPNNLWVLHRCDNPLCTRAEHLFLGTAADNSADMVSKGRQSRGLKHSLSKRGTEARGDSNGARLHPERLARGAANPATKLTKEQVLEIRRLRSAENISASKVGVIFGVAKSTILRIEKRHIWAHL